MGIQASLAIDGLPGADLDLYSIIDGMVADPSASATVFANDPARDLWREIASMLEKKLGFSLEPELFSNMLFVAACGDAKREDLRSIVRELCDVFRDTDADGLYHFFLSLKFACDLDCTGVAARARLVSGDIDPRTPDGARALRKITQRILKSAATTDVPAEVNASHGKENGALSRYVFKVYADDHEVQGPECDRGLKNNPVVVANALYAVLFELRHGLRSPKERIQLREYVEGSKEPRTTSATVAEIVAANVCYVTGHLLSGAYRRGCRYYTSPDAFLCFLSESLRDFPEVFEAFRAQARLREAVILRRSSTEESTGLNPLSSLNTAFRAIAAANVGMDSEPDVERLLARQGDDGSWSDADTLYSLGTTRELHFRSSMVTTGFAIQALTGREPLSIRSSGSENWADAILDEIVATTIV
ncbi:MAG: hypothetical protein U0271_00805 [Polyangiaceae bacterium]